jgi:PEP-CTERM motif
MFLAAAVTAAAANLPNCSWDRPGHNPFMGDVVAAVDRYRDIPPDIRARLKARMAARQYDEMVTIRRDAIVGRARYGSDIRDMHFGQGQVCGTVTRARWTADLQERGLVYCDGGHCVLVPTVCRNVSRIQRLSPATAEGPAATGAVPGAGGQASGGGADDPAAAMADALANAPPGAGLGQLPAAGNAGDSFAQGAGLGGPDVAPSGGSAGQGGHLAGPGAGNAAGGMLAQPGLGLGGAMAIAPALAAATVAAVGDGAPTRATGDLRDNLAPDVPLSGLPGQSWRAGDLPLPDGLTLGAVLLPVPEPTSAWLMLAGVAGLLAWRRRRTAASAAGG